MGDIVLKYDGLEGCELRKLDISCPQISSTRSSQQARRILISNNSHEIVLDHLDVLRTSYSQNSDPYAIYSLPPRYAYQAHHSKSVILDLINDICASIPYLLSYDPEDPPDPPSKRGPHAAGGNAAVWPLYVAGQLDICPTSTRTWILGRLHKIGTEMGVRQAITLEKVLRSGREVLKLMDETQDDDKDDSWELGV